MKYQVAVIPGDGIGKEVVPAARRVLDDAGDRWGFGIDWTTFEWGCEYYVRTGEMMPEGALDRLAPHDAIFLGAVGYPGVPDHVSLWGLLIPIRRVFRQRVNYRPIRRFPGIEGPLKDSAADIDFVVVRENNEGEYSEIGGRIYHGLAEEIAIQESVFTRRGVENVMRYAFDLAGRRAGRLVSATKSNGIVHTMPFWDEVFSDVASEYGGIETSQVHIDALAALFVQRPETLDVVVASNLFGDILSDLGAAIAGSIGIAPSANLDPTRTHPSMFEPVHGSAPDIAGQGIANPIGQIWSGALMLDHLGQSEAARAVVTAMGNVFASGGPRTPDLGGTAGTEDVTGAVLEEMARLSP
ncbi:tartrate dehydrogenase [Amycolatopsis palatopharyngis]|uniref:tartrate dehydrogenase n=1 Tax=Amycolatopsis palatopharyngis TaxID=187982 RepID=UPI000E25909E|nr:tartrate dehydrogenase [Amycolatopsis palatopharyngis]